MSDWMRVYACDCGYVARVAPHPMTPAPRLIACPSCGKDHRRLHSVVNGERVRYQYPAWPERIARWVRTGWWRREWQFAPAENPKEE